MKPVDFPASNATIGGEVPVNRCRGIVLSCWRGNWRERLAFLLFGRLWLAVKGDIMPPTLITSDRAFRITNPPEQEEPCER